jgi:hypothetical protein
LSPPALCFGACYHNVAVSDRVAFRQRAKTFAGSERQTAGIQDVYLQAVHRLAACYTRSPDGLSQEEVRAYLLHLQDERGVARGTFSYGGIRFLFHRTLKRDWPLF